MRFHFFLPSFPLFLSEITLEKEEEEASPSLNLVQRLIIFKHAAAAVDDGDAHLDSGPSLDLYVQMIISHV